MLSAEVEAIRLLLGALYTKCGFTHTWNRQYGITNYPSRYEVLVAASSELEKCGISSDDLVSRYTPYWPLGDQYIQERPRPLKRVAQILRNMYKSPGNEERCRILLGIWKFVTQYESYDEVSNSWLTEDGVSDIDIYGDVDIEKLYEEIRQLG